MISLVHSHTYHIQTIFSFSRCLCIQFRFIYIFFLKHCFDFIAWNSLTFDIFTVAWFWHHRCYINSSKKVEYLWDCSLGNFLRLLGFISSVSYIFIFFLEGQCYSLVDTNILFIQNIFLHSKAMFFLIDCLECIVDFCVLLKV